MSIAAADPALGSPRHHPVLAEAFAALDDAGVRWCLLRDVGATQPPAGDVDLLVDPRDRRRADAALVRAGFEPHPRPARGTHRTHLAHDVSSGDWIKLDVVTDVAFGPQRSWRPMSGDRVLARAIHDPSPPRPAADDATWLLTAHGLLDRGALSSDRLAEAQRTAARSTLAHPVAVSLERARPAGAGAAVVRAAMLRGDRERLATIGAVAWSSLHRSLTRRERTRLRMRTAVQRLRRRLARTPLLAPTGLSVALLAPDGAGKSTLAATLQDRWALPVRVHYLGLYPAEDPWVQRGPRLLRPVRRYGRMWATVVRAGLDRARGCLVVLDRHPREALLDRDGRPKAQLRRLLFGRLVPGPDLVVVLDAPPELLAARKPEHTVAELAQRRERYLALADRTRGARVVDTSGEVTATADRLMSVIWSAWRARGRR